MIQRENKELTVVRENERDERIIIMSYEFPFSENPQINRS